MLQQLQCSAVQLPGSLKLAHFRKEQIMMCLHATTASYGCNDWEFCSFDAHAIAFTAALTP